MDLSPSHKVEGSGDHTTFWECGYRTWGDTLDGEGIGGGGAYGRGPMLASVGLPTLV